METAIWNATNVHQWRKKQRNLVRKKKSQIGMTKKIQSFQKSSCSFKGSRGGSWRRTWAEIFIFQILHYDVRPFRRSTALLEVGMTRSQGVFRRGQHWLAFIAICFNIVVKSRTHLPGGEKKTSAMCVIRNDPIHTSTWNQTHTHTHKQTQTDTKTRTEEKIFIKVKFQQWKYPIEWLPVYTVHSSHWLIDWLQNSVSS
jgi:hypothetical protein